MRTEAAGKRLRLAWVGGMLAALPIAVGGAAAWVNGGFNPLGLLLGLAVVALCFLPLALHGRPAFAVAATALGAVLLLLGGVATLMFGFVLWPGAALLLAAGTVPEHWGYRRALALVLAIVAACFAIVIAAFAVSLLLS